MSRIKIDDLKHDTKKELSEDSMRHVTGGRIGGWGNDLLNADDVPGSRNGVDAADYAVWRANYGATS